ncbi:MAG: hypothetical protein [Caudoviricetes sp.]|nr:MAG: hypothetical protein [Caudoviricetes sp.]
MSTKKLPSGLREDCYMKTQHEIELMKSDIESKISKLQDRYIDCITPQDSWRISDQILQLKAQYNILLEVLK